MKLWLAVSLALAVGPACHAASAIPPDVASLIELTRTTQASYSLYVWNNVRLPNGTSKGEWAAEFNAGPLHRVEVPAVRIVANCVDLTGTMLNVTTGEIRRGPEIARAACGIQSNAKIISARRVGDVKVGNVAAIKIEVRDPVNVRTYSIAGNGALVAATVVGPDGALLLDGRLIALRNDVPPGIFTESSLSKSAVAAKFRREPPESP